MRMATISAPRNAQARTGQLEARRPEEKGLCTCEKHGFVDICPTSLYFCFDFVWLTGVESSSHSTKLGRRTESHSPFLANACPPHPFPSVPQGEGGDDRPDREPPSGAAAQLIAQRAWRNARARPKALLHHSDEAGLDREPRPQPGGPALHIWSHFAGGDADPSAPGHDW